MLSPNELASILESHDEACNSGIAAALATVVCVEGSSYRRPGARMLVRDDGRIIGGVSGGCLEEDVIRKCRLSMVEGVPAVLTYDTTDELDAGFGAALGCGGAIHILVEPLGIQTKFHVDALRSAQRNRKPQVLVISFVGQVGAVAHYGAHEGLRLANDVSPAVEPLVKLECERALRARCWRVSRLAGQQWFFDYLPPSPRLLIFGGGPDIEPLAACADQLGFAVRVVDPRPGFIGRRRFASSVHAAAIPFEHAALYEGIDEYTACVIATHSFALDKLALQHVLRSAAGYAGLLGPVHRSKRLLDELIAGSSSIGVGLKRLHSPVGLDIGADTPEQVSLAILAEIQAVFARCEAGFLRNKRGSIHHDAPCDGDIGEEVCV